jgi:chromosome partitioning protein
MKVIALASAKGGVGKSTLTVNLACAMLEEGLAVTVLDIDPQGSAVLWDELRTKTAGGPILPTVKASSVGTLEDELRRLAREGMDYVVIDMPGWSSDLLNDVLRSCDLVLVPSRASIIDIAPASATIETAMRFGIPFCYVMNFVPEDRTMFLTVKDQLETAGLLVSPIALPDSQTFPMAFMQGKAVTEYEPRGKAANEVRWLWRFLKGLV